MTDLGARYDAATCNRRMVLRLTALAGLGMAAAACTDADSDSNTAQQITSSTTARPTKSWGAFIPSVLPAAGSASSPITALSSLAGSSPKYLHLFRAIGDEVPIAELDAIVAAGATPLVTLEPWRPDDGITQPAYALARIAAGAHAEDLSRWGRDLAAWGRPVLLRWAQEMNGTWYPWSVGVNGNTAADYRAAWSVMRAAMAPAEHIQLVWAPNTLTLGTNQFADCFPGASQVDVLGLDGYNWGDHPGHRWQRAAELFTPGITALTELGNDLPILITEVASADGDTPAAKAGWITDFLEIVENQSRIEGFVWFQMDKERDWRFNSTPQSTAAFRSGIAELGA